MTTIAEAEAAVKVCRTAVNVARATETHAREMFRAAWRPRVESGEATFGDWAASFERAHGRRPSHSVDLCHSGWCVNHPGIWAAADPNEAPWCDQSDRYGGGCLGAGCPGPRKAEPEKYTPDTWAKAYHAWFGRAPTLETADNEQWCTNNPDVRRVCGADPKPGCPCSCGGLGCPGPAPKAEPDEHVMASRRAALPEIAKRGLRGLADHLTRLHGAAGKGTRGIAVGDWVTAVDGTVARVMQIDRQRLAARLDAPPRRRVGDGERWDTIESLTARPMTWEDRDDVGGDVRAIADPLANMVEAVDELPEGITPATARSLAASLLRAADEADPPKHRVVQVTTSICDRPVVIFVRNDAAALSVDEARSLAEDLRALADDADPEGAKPTSPTRPARSESIAHVRDMVKEGRLVIRGGAPILQHDILRYAERAKELGITIDMEQAAMMYGHSVKLAMMCNKTPEQVFEEWVAACRYQVTPDPSPPGAGEE